MRIWALVLTMFWGVGLWGMDRALAAPTLLTVGVEEQNYLPNYAWIDGAFKGVAAEILTAFAADQGYQIQFHPLPIRRLYSETASGAVDLKFPDSPQWSPDAKAGHEFVYSRPVLGYVDGVLVKTNNLGRTIEQVRTLGTVSGFTLPSEWRTRIDSGKMELKEATKLDQLLRMVLLDRVEGAYVSVASALYVADTVLGQKGVLALDPNLPLRRDNYLLSSVTHPEVIREFDTWLAAHKDQVKAIKARWGVEE